MKRNKRTEKIWQTEWSPLTERILVSLGAEGLKIRRRLQLFYQKRAVPGEEAEGAFPAEP
jgi:hypothetical protein